MLRRAGATPEQIEAAYRAGLPAFRRVAAAIVGEREAGGDAVQEAFAAALVNRRSFRGGGPLEAGLWRLVVNTARSRRRGAHVDEPLESARAGRNGGAETVDERVHAALTLLPERQRLVLFLRYYADLDYATIARVADIAPGTVAAT